MDNTIMLVSNKQISSSMYCFLQFHTWEKKIHLFLRRILVYFVFLPLNVDNFSAPSLCTQLNHMICADLTNTRWTLPFSLKFMFPDIYVKRILHVATTKNYNCNFYKFSKQRNNIQLAQTKAPWVQTLHWFQKKWLKVQILPFPGCFHSNFIIGVHSWS